MKYKHMCGLYKKFGLRLPKGSLSLTGLTFIEMLLATVMITVISVALYGMLANGIRVWQKVNQETPQIDMNLFFERLELELRNCVYFKDMTFDGQEERFSFPTAVVVPVRANGFSNGIGRITYSFNKDARSLERNYIDYQNSNSMKAPLPRALINSVEELTFSYYFFSRDKQQFFWSDVWPPEEMTEKKDEYPQAVRVSMVLDLGETTQKRIKTINIPIAGKMR